ncbi:MAG: tyrosine--tRNA ligase [Candidatus Aminicenantes bacterium]|nr:tyrosine--tRNA ligase [Candidatus Aminicenantes bacterium]
MGFPDVGEQLDLLRKGALEIISEEDLEKKIRRSRKTGKPLLIKAGFDPTAPDIHLGHTVLIRKMKHFQDLGHTVVFLIGDFTGLIGDPSGRNKTRPPLNQQEIALNAETYKEQIFKLLDPQKTVIDFNSRWLGALTPVEIIRLTAAYTVARILERDDFSKRYKNGDPISVHELLYPLMQGYDSVAMHADVELGGSDQKFNLLVGRELQRHYGQEAQVIVTMPLLEGLNGIQKMSKSLGNYIGIHESPAEMFGKVMSVSDDLMFRYYELLTDLALKNIARMRADMDEGKANPMQAKIELAKLIIADFHSRAAAEAAEAEFIKVFRNKETPDDVEVLTLATDEALVDFLVRQGILASRGEAKRIHAQGGIYLDHQRPESIQVMLQKGKPYLLKIGKRKFYKIEAAG